MSARVPQINKEFSDSVSFIYVSMKAHASNGLDSDLVIQQ